MCHVEYVWSDNSTLFIFMGASGKRSHDFRISCSIAHPNTFDTMDSRQEFTIRVHRMTNRPLTAASGQGLARSPAAVSLPFRRLATVLLAAGMHLQNRPGVPPRRRRTLPGHLPTDSGPTRRNNAAQLQQCRAPHRSEEHQPSWLTCPASTQLEGVVSLAPSEAVFSAASGSNSSAVKPPVMTRVPGLRERCR